MTDEIYESLKTLNKKKSLLKKAFEVKSPERIPTGTMTLDRALGGGWPLGRLVTLWGKQGTTKSTLCLWAIANAQKMGKNCLYVDAEKSFTSEWAESYGVDVDNLLVLRSRDIDTILEYVAPVGDQLDVIVIDSISTINSIKYFVENDGSLGLQSRITKELISKLEYLAPEALILAITQSTMKFDGRYANLGFTGGLALEHESSIIIKLFIKSNKEDILFEDNRNGDRTHQRYRGTDISWRIDKSKISLPNQEGRYRFISGIGCDDRLELLVLAEEYGIVKVKGSYYYLRGEDGGSSHGLEAAMQELEDPEIYRRLKDEVSQKIRG